MHMSPELLKVVMGGGAPCALNHRKEMLASSRGWLVPFKVAGQVGRTPQTRRRHYNVATSPDHRPGMATWTKTLNTPGQAGFLSPQKHINRAGTTVFFPRKIPQRGIDQDVCHSRGIVFVVFSFFFLFHRNLSQQHYHLRYFIERKQWSPENKNHPLAGRAGSRIWETSLHQ